MNMLRGKLVVGDGVKGVYSGQCRALAAVLVDSPFFYKSLKIGAPQKAFAKSFTGMV